MTIALASNVKRAIRGEISGQRGIVGHLNGNQLSHILSKCLVSEVDSGNGDSPIRAAVDVHSENSDRVSEVEQGERDSQPSKRSSRSENVAGADNPAFDSGDEVRASVQSFQTLDC